MTKTLALAIALALTPAAAFAGERLSDADYIRAAECAALAKASLTTEQQQQAKAYVKDQAERRSKAVESIAFNKVRSAKAKASRASAERIAETCAGLPLADLTVAKTPGGAGGAL
jgi:hypothetical protein